MPPDPAPDHVVERRSLEEEACREASDYRWYRSEEAGRDIGDEAYRRWVQEHWAGFLRARWIEHMCGECYWEDLGRGEFGLLKQVPLEHQGLLEQVLDRLRGGGAKPEPRYLGQQDAP
jgi:hypothetical protein